MVFSQITWTSEQKGRKAALNNVLLQGFSSIEDIEIAILETNHDLPEDEQEFMRQDMARFKSFFNNTESSHSFLANMTEVRPEIDFGYATFRLRRNLNDSTMDEPRVSELEEAPVMIASIQSDYPDLTDSMLV